MNHSQSPSEQDRLAAWLRRAETASTLEEALDCTNQALALNPSDPVVQQKVYRIFQSLLKHDPHLVYLNETDGYYRVRSGERMELMVPKDRSIPAPYPPADPALIRWARRFLWLALLGLFSAGLGTMLFAPLAALSAIALNFQPITRPTRILSLVLLILAASLWLAGLLLSSILVMHLL